MAMNGFRTTVDKTMGNDAAAPAAAASSTASQSGRGPPPQSHPQHENTNVGLERGASKMANELETLRAEDEWAPSILQDDSEIMRSNEIHRSSATSVHQLDDIAIIMNSLNSNRGLRGDASESASESAPESVIIHQSVEHIESAGGTTSELLNFTSISSTSDTSYIGRNISSNSADTNGAHTLLLTILCFVLFSPCLLAAVFQSVYCIKKRQRDRVERELEAVSTNPTSRMLVLSEIFKNDSQPVTESDASPKKKRVLVKKHRKKTSSERRQKNRTSSDNSDEEEEGAHGDEETGGIHHGDFWSSEEEENDKPLVVYVSSFDYLEESKTGNADEPPLQMGENEDEDGIIAAASDEKPMLNDDILLDNAENSGKLSDELQGEQDQVSTVGDLVDEAVIVNVVHKSQDVNNVIPVRGGTNISDNIGNEDGDAKKDLSDNVANELGCRKDSKDSALQDLDSISKERQDCEDVVPSPSTPETDAPVLDSCKSQEMENVATKETQQRVLLTPKILSMPSLDSDEKKEISEESLAISEKSPTGTTLSPSSAPDMPPLAIVTTPSPKKYLLPRSSADNDGTILSSSLSIPGLSTMPNLSDDEDNNDDDERVANKVSIFRAASSQSNDEGDNESIPSIHGCGSSITEVTSNVDELKAERTMSFEDIKLEPLRTTSSTNDKGGAPANLYHPYQMERAGSGTSTLSSGLGRPIPLNPVGSYISTASSNISYFSYEDVSIASEESEMCAICLCPYEEGDIRILSKRCPHVFHKECILEWLVKSHNECPCCRIDMVTKSEIKATSASLIGTERLAQAMAVAGSEMQEAPPFRVRRRPPQLARQMLARAREHRRRSGQTSEGSGDSPSMQMPPQSPNAHWLWSARFDNGNNSPSSATIGQSPGLTPGGRSSMWRTDDRGSHPTNSPSSTRANNAGSNQNTHNRDWLWAARFSTPSNNTTNNSTTTQPTTINPSRSSDAIMNPHESHQNAPEEAPSPTTSHRHGDEGASMHNNTAGSLFTSAFHNHWQQRSTRDAPRTATARLSSPPRHSRRHNHWRQNPSSSSSHSNTNDDVLPELPVTVLPAI